MIMVLQQIKAEIKRRKKVISDACGGVIVSNSNHVEYKTLCELEEYINTNFDETCEKIERYNPFKASIESIADMCDRYGRFGDDRANDFANNIKVKCKDAMEYNSIYKEDHIEDILEIVDMQWLTPQLDKSYAAYGERKMMELTRFDGYAMLDAIAFGRKQATREFEKNRLAACEKPLTFKAVPRLLSMVEPSRKAKSYCEKLAKSLEHEGYLVDAKIVHESIKIMDGEKVPMATMDEEAKQFAEEYSFNIESDLYQTLTDEQRGSWKKEIENAIKVGVRWQTERFENNRVNAFKNQTEEEAQIEMDFAVSIIEKEHRTPTFDDAIKYGMKLQQMKDNQDELPKWRYKKDNAPLIRDSIILNKYGCVAKSPSGAIVCDVWVIDYDELAKLPKEEQQ